MPRHTTATALLVLGSSFFTSLSPILMASGQSVTPSCDFGPDALTNQFGGYPVPRTCVDVPFDDGTTTTVTERCFYTYAPASCASAEAVVPLVVNIHGRNGCPGLIAGYSGWIQKAEAECFVVMMPSSSMDPRFTESCWNLPGFAVDNDFGIPGGNNILTSPCCCATPEEDALGFFGIHPTPDDTTFLKMAIDSVLETFPTVPGVNLSLDADRVYMAGHSNGCIAALATAAVHSETVAAVCCHAGALITPFDARNYPSPVPIWMVSGRQDTVIAYEGYAVETPFGMAGLWSVDDTTEYLQAMNGCTSDTTVPFTDETTGEVAGSVRTGSGCANDATVEILTLDESGHLIFPYVFDPSYGGSPTTVDTTSMAWEFCSAQAKTAPPTPAPTTKSAKKSPKKGKKKDKKSKSDKKSSKS